MSADDLRGEASHMNEVGIFFNVQQLINLSGNFILTLL